MQQNNVTPSCVYGEINGFGRPKNADPSPEKTVFTGLKLRDLETSRGIETPLVISPLTNEVTP
jgi:hypothetical protein